MKGWRGALAIVPVVALTRCGGAANDEATGATASAIVYGQEVDAPNSPVLLLNGPEGLCTAILLAPTLVATARHCVAPVSQGTFACTPGGDLQSGSTGGALGSDNAPGSLAFFSSAHVAAAIGSATPDASGARILSTGAPTACRDDIAFVVLDQSIPGIVPVPVRLDAATAPGESISLWGYGLTEEAAARIALRMHDGVQIIAVGPDTSLTLPQGAPVRAVRVGPGTVSCNGDSGGPILSIATGALIAIVSLGIQADMGPYCDYSADSNTTGPRLADYRDLALSAYAAAGALPVPEPSTADAALDVVSDEGRAEADAQGPPAPETHRAGCSATAEGAPFGRGSGGTLAAVVAVAAARRRRVVAHRSRPTRQAGSL